MKRRVYNPGLKRQKLMLEAMDTAREAREAIDPLLLQKAREAIGEAVESLQEKQGKPMQAERVPVDRRKNLSIVMKYLEMHPDNQALRKEVASFLSGR